MSKVITIEDLNGYMQSAPDPNRGQTVVDAVNQWLENYTNRIWGATKTFTGRYDWTNRRVIWLRRMDVLASEPVVVKLGWPGQAQQTMDPSGYYVTRVGRLTFLGQVLSGSLANRASSYNDYLEITYTCGNKAVPADLKMAALGIAAGYYEWAINGNRDLAAVSVGSYQLTFTNKRSSGGQADSATSTGDANFAIVASYKMRRQ